jgi:hypothetical protein
MFFSRTQATWFLTEALFLVTLSVMCALAFAQSGEPARGNTPPGTSQDGSAPAHGAIKGGPSIAPGETAGVPGRKPGNSPAESAEMRRHCDELTGPLRDECLDKPRDAATGGTAPRDVLKKPY